MIYVKYLLVLRDQVLMSCLSKAERFWGEMHDSFSAI